jgi:hypothetical protein
LSEFALYWVLVLSRVGPARCRRCNALTCSDAWSRVCRLFWEQPQNSRSRTRSTLYPTCYPTYVRKSSVYLEDTDVARLRRLAAAEGRSQAEIIRAALAAYEAQTGPDREFALAGSWTGDGSSIADVDEADLLRGFGE